MVMCLSSWLTLVLPLAVARWTPPQERHTPHLTLVPLMGVEGGEGDASLGVLVSEEWSAETPRASNSGRSVELRGTSRAFLAQAPLEPPTGPIKWTDVSFRKLHLLNKVLSFEVDVSQVRCGCNAAV